MLALGFSHIPFLRRRKLPCMSNFWVFLFWKRLDFLKGFLCIYLDGHWVFVLLFFFFLDIMYSNWIWLLREPCNLESIPHRKPHDLFHVLLERLAGTFLRTFWSAVFLYYGIFAWFWKGNILHSNSVWASVPSLDLWEHFCESSGLILPSAEIAISVVNSGVKRCHWSSLVPLWEEFLLMIRHSPSVAMFALGISFWVGVSSFISPGISFFIQVGEFVCLQFLVVFHHNPL